MEILPAYDKMSSVDCDAMRNKNIITKLRAGENNHILKRFLYNKHIKLIAGSVFLLILLVVNCVLYFSEAIKPDDDFVVVIDPGHGGNDPGKVGTSNVKEKDVNLAIALKLRDSLEERGVKVVLTRENDTNLATPGATNKKTSDMNNRVELINESRADILISIHQNSYPDASVKGAQVFYHGTSEESRKLAETLQSALISEVDPDNNRAAKEGNDYFILRKSTCPGVIIECGFLSCPEETAKLVDEEYQEKLAETIAESVCRLYGVK